jgi:YD repeat-containing protein
VVTPSQTVNAAYDAQDRLLSAGSATYVHAATGERTMKIVGADTTRTRYDAFGNLRDVYLPNGTHVQYAVDAQQRRTARLVNGTVTAAYDAQDRLLSAGSARTGIDYLSVKNNIMHCWL